VIKQKKKNPRGDIYTLSISDYTLDVLLTTHAYKRIMKWELTVNKVFEAILYPEEVVLGHRNRYIAHRLSGDHIIRVIYEYEEKLPVIVTVYYPYSKRYFKGGGTYEDKILG